jgi:hypothetical protein
MTMEQAQKIGWEIYSTGGTCVLRFAQELVHADRAARRETLEWVRDHVLINDRADDGPMHVAIKRCLKELREEHR